MLTYHLTPDEAKRWRERGPEAEAFRRELLERVSALARVDGEQRAALVEPDGQVVEGWSVSTPTI